LEFKKYLTFLEDRLNWSEVRPVFKKHLNG